MRAVAAAAASLTVLVAVAALAPQWLVFMTMLALAKGIVVLGLVLLMRMGLVSFGQGLYFGIGAYAAALLSDRWQVQDAGAMLVIGPAAAALTALILGLLLARYREIFFAMLSLAFSMILYGILVKSASLGSTDGFNLSAHSLFGFALPPVSARRIVLLSGGVAAIAVTLLLRALLAGGWGRLAAAIKDNELRVSYLGTSPYRVVYTNYVIAAALGGLGGALAALSVGHVDPDATYWTTSGEFVFIAILGGIQSVLAPFVATAIFEVLRTLASQYAPNVWQMSLGIAMLTIIMVLPAGLWSLLKRKGKAA